MMKDFVSREREKEREVTYIHLDKKCIEMIRESFAFKRGIRDSPKASKGSEIKTTFLPETM